MTQTVDKLCGIQSLLTLDNDTRFIRRLVMTLPKGVEEATLERLKKAIEKRGFRIINIEKK